MSKELIKRETFGIATPYKAKQMALVLQKHIIDNKLSVNIQGHEYVQVEGWQFAGGLMGLFPQIVEVKEIGPMKWMAKAEIRNVKTDKVVGVGFAVCSKEENKKKTFDEYAIVSMAQTRAIGKAYRNYIGWIIKMAGYESTPAEEMPKVSKETQEKATKSNASNFLEQLKAEVFKAGAKNEKDAVAIINQKTGLKLTDLQLTEKHSAIVLEKFLTSK
jgi:hypothetical protein